MGFRMFQGYVAQGCKADGDVIEMGVGMGGAGDPYSCFDTAVYIREKFLDKKIYACDCFKGLPYTEDCSFLKIGECFTFTAEEFIEAVKKEKLENIIVPVVGLFKDTLPSLSDKRFCFAYLDADLYQSTLVAVKFLISRMTIGGVMGFHDCESGSRCKGVIKVIREYMEPNPKYKLMNGNESTYQFFERIKE